MPLTVNDFLPGDLEGSAELLTKESKFTKMVILDGIPEGNEKFIARLRQYSTDGTILASSGIKRINDTSQAVAGPAYNLSASSPKVFEGQQVMIILTTLNVPMNTTIPYTITGVTSADIAGASLTGNFLVDSNGMSVQTVTISATQDSTVEGRENMTVTLTGITPTISVTVAVKD